MIRTTFLAALSVIVSISPLVVRAADLWVDIDSIGGPCSDSVHRDHVARNNPWCNLGIAANNVLPGDVVHVREGVYSETHGHGNPVAWNLAVLQMVTSGTPEAWIRFVAEPGEKVELTGDGGALWGILASDSDGFKPRYVEIDGFVVHGFPWKGVLVQETSDVVFKNLEVYGNTEGAIGVLQSARVTVEGCRVHDNHLTGWTSPVNYWQCLEGGVIRGNFIWDNTDEDERETEGHGIILDTCDESGSTLVENNVIWDNEGLCINVFNSNNATVRNNTCYRNNLGRTEGTVGELWLRGENLSAYNNLLVSRDHGPALRISDNGGDLGTIGSDHNILWSPNHQDVAGWPPWNTGTLAEYRAATGNIWDVNSAQVDPQLADPGNAVFELTEDSPAVDGGENSVAAAIDVQQHLRPFDGDGDGVATADQGAYEYRSTLGVDVFSDGFETGGSGEWDRVNGGPAT